MACDEQAILYGTLAANEGNALNIAAHHLTKKKSLCILIQSILKIL